MNTKRLRLAVTVTAAALLIVSTPALARRGGGHGPFHGRGGPGHHGPGGGHGFFNAEMVESLAAELNLDERTLARVKDLIYESDKGHIELEAEAQRAHLELRKLLDADSPKTDAVMCQIEEVGTKEVALRKNRMGLFLSVRSMLTPEQRSKLRNLMHERRAAKRGPGFGGTGMGPCGMESCAEGPGAQQPPPQQR